MNKIIAFTFLSFGFMQGAQNADEWNPWRSTELSDSLDLVLKNIASLSSQRERRSQQIKKMRSGEMRLTIESKEMIKKTTGLEDDFLISTANMTEVLFGAQKSGEGVFFKNQILFEEPVKSSKKTGQDKTEKKVRFQEDL